MGRSLRAVGVIGLLVGNTGQPIVAEIIDRERHPAIHQDDTGAEAPWRLPIDGVVGIQDLLPGPLSVSVTSAGAIRSGGKSSGTSALTLSEIGNLGELFPMTEAEFFIRTPGVLFAGTPIVTAPNPTKVTAALSRHHRRLLVKLEAKAPRRQPSQVTVSGLWLEADRAVAAPGVVEAVLSERSPRRLTRTRIVGSPGTVVAAPDAPDQATTAMNKRLTASKWGRALQMLLSVGRSLRVVVAAIASGVSESRARPGQPDAS